MSGGEPALAEVLERLAALGIDVPPGPVRLDHYGDTPALSEALLALIESGRKRAGTGLLWWHEHHAVPLPRAGDIEIVLTHDHQPRLVTRITRVELLPFDAVDAAYAAIEGEGDGSLGDWREAHWSTFSRLAPSIGRTPEPDMPVVCSVFELLAIVRLD